MEAIYGPDGIKAGFSQGPKGENNAKLLADQRKALEAAGATAIISGCTEIPLVLHDPALVNPTQVLADEIVRRALADRA